MTGHSKHAVKISRVFNRPDCALPIPTPSISPTFAPGKKGPAGLAPRTNYSRVNTGEPPAADAGAAGAKSRLLLGGAEDVAEARKEKVTWETLLDASRCKTS